MTRERQRVRGSAWERQEFGAEATLPGALPPSAPTFFAWWRERRSADLCSCWRLAWAHAGTDAAARLVVLGVVAGVADAFGIAALYQALADWANGNRRAGGFGDHRDACRCWSAFAPRACRTGLQLAGFVLALVSIWLIARPDGEIDSHRGLGLAVLAGIMFGAVPGCGQAGRLHGGVFWPLVAARTASTF